MTLTSFEGREGRQDCHGGDVAYDTSTLPLETHAYNLARSDKCSAHAEQSNSLDRVPEDSCNSCNGPVSFREESGVLKSKLLKVGVLADEESLIFDAFTEDHRERASHGGVTSVTHVSPAIPARLKQNPAASLAASPFGHEDDADNSTEENSTGSTSENPVQKHRSAPSLIGPPCVSQHIAVDIQALQALQERLLFSEEKLWLTQRQLVDEQGKEVHLKSQILFLEDEVERAQAEGLATAARYAEQAETLQQLQDKVDRLSKENDSLESCLSEKISEGRALQELAQRLILRLGNKTEYVLPEVAHRPDTVYALLEEGICVTRVLAPAWKRRELLAELERKNLLRFQLAHIALLYCSDDTAESQEVPKGEAFVSLEEHVAPGQTPPFASTRPGLRATVANNRESGQSLPPGGTLDKQATAESFSTAALDRPPQHRPPAGAVIRDASLSCEALGEDRSDCAAAGELLKLQDTYNIPLLHQSPGSGTLVDGVITRVSAAAHRFGHHVDCTRADPSEGASPTRDMPVIQTERITPSSPRNEKPTATAALPPDCPRLLPSLPLVGDAAAVESAQQPDLQSPGSPSELQFEISLSGERQKKTREAEEGPSLTKQRDDAHQTEAIRHAMSAGGGVVNPYSVAAHLDFLSAAAGRTPTEGNCLSDSQRPPLLDAKTITPCPASDTPAGTTADTEFLLCKDDRSGSHEHLGDAQSTRFIHYQRTRSEASQVCLSDSRFPTPPSHSTSSDEAGVTTNRRLPGGKETFSASSSNDNAGAGSCGPLARADSSQGSRQRDKQLSRLSSAPKERVLLATWTGEARTSAERSLLESYPELREEKDEKEHVYSSDGHTSLVPVNSDGEAATQETDPSFGDGSSDRAANQTVGQTVSSNDANGALGVSHEKQINQPSSSRSKLVSSLQPPACVSRTPSPRPVYSTESSRGEQIGGCNPAAEQSAAATNSQRSVAPQERSFVAATTAGVKISLHSPEGAAAAGEREVTLSLQTTPRGTLCRDSRSPQAAALAAMLREEILVQPTQNGLQKAWQHVQSIADERACSYVVQQAPQTQISFDTVAVGEEQEEAQLGIVGAGGTAHEAATATAIRAVESDTFSGQRRSCAVESGDVLTYECSSLSAEPRRDSGDARVVTDTPATTCSIVQGEADAAAYRKPERKVEQAGGYAAHIDDSGLERKSTCRQAKYESNNVQEFCFSLERPSASTVELPQVAQQAESSAGLQHHPPLPPGARSVHISSVRLLPFETQKSSSQRKSCGLISETLTCARAGARHLSLERQETVRDGQINTRTSHTQHALASLSRGREPPTGEPSKATVNRETMANRRRSATSYLPPLPQHDQPKLPRAFTLAAEPKDNPTPVHCQASRRSAGTNTGVSEPSAVGGRLLKKLNDSRKVCLSRDYGAARRSSRRPNKASPSTDLEDMQEACGDNFLRVIQSLPSPKQRDSFSSSGATAEPALHCASSLCLRNKSVKTRLPLLESRRSSHSTAKRGPTRTTGDLKASKQSEGHQEEQQDCLVSSRSARVAARQPASQRARCLIPGAVTSAYNGVESEALEGVYSFYLVENGEVLSSGGATCDSRSSQKETRRSRNVGEETPRETSASSLSCKSGTPSEGFLSKATDRRLSMLHTGSRGGKALKGRGSRVGSDAALHAAAMKRGSSVVSRSSSALMGRMPTAASTNKKKTGTKINGSTCLYDDIVAHSPISPTCCSGRSSSSSRSNKDDSGSSSTCGVYNGSSGAGDLVYHLMLASGTGVQQQAAPAPALCVDQRTEGDRPSQRTDVHTTHTSEFEQPRVPGPGVHPSRAEYGSFVITRDERCATSNSGPQQEGKCSATSVTLPCLGSTVNRSSPASNSKEEGSHIIVAGDRNTTSCTPAAVKKSFPLLAPEDSTAPADEQESERKLSDRNSDLYVHAPIQESPASAQAVLPTAGPCAFLLLRSGGPPTGPRADEPVANSPYGLGEVRDRQVDGEAQVKGQQPQDHKHQDSFTRQVTASPPRVASWSPFDASPGAELTSPRRGASVRISLPPRNGTCIPSHVARIVRNRAAGELAAESLKPKDTEAVERGTPPRLAGCPESAVFPGGAADRQKLRASRRALLAVSRQFRSEMLANPSPCSLRVPPEAPDSPTGKPQVRRTFKNVPFGQVSSPNMRASLGRASAALGTLHTKPDGEKLNSQQGIEGEKRGTPRLPVAAMSGSSSHTEEKETAGLPEYGVQTAVPSTRESDTQPPRIVQAAAAFPAIAGSFADTTSGKAEEESPSKSEGLIKACMQYTAPSVTQAPTYSAAAGNKCSPFGLQQPPPDTTVYQPPLCGMFAAAPAARLTYGAAPAVFPLCTRSSVPLQQQSRYRNTVQNREPSQHQRSVATVEYRQEQGGATLCLPQKQPQHLVDCVARLQPQTWEPMQAQQSQQPLARPQQCKEQQMTTQVAQPLLGSWKCQRQQHIGVQQHQQSHEQAQKQHMGGPALPQAVVRRPLQPQTQLQHQEQQHPRQPVKLGQSRSQPSRVMPAHFLRQTLPRRSAENAAGIPPLSRQQQSLQPQGMLREKLRQQQIATSISGKALRATATEQQSTCDSRRVVQLQQQPQRQKKITSRLHQQRRGTTGQLQQAINALHEEYQHPHIVSLKSPHLRPEAARQGEVQELEGMSRQPRQQQSHADLQEQQQLAAGIVEGQSALGGPHTGNLSHTHGSIKAEQQVSHPQQASHAKEAPQLQQHSVQRVQQFEQHQLPQSLQGVRQIQAQHVHYPCGTAVQKQQLQPQDKPQQRYHQLPQQQQQPHAMSMRWSCGVPSGTKQEPFGPQQQLQQQVQLHWQQQMQHSLLQPQPQQPLRTLHADGHLHQSQLQQPQQQQVLPDQLQHQRTQQQVLQQHLWNVVQMYHRGALPTYAQKGNYTGAVCNTSSRTSLVNPGPYPVIHKAFACDSRATISAGFNRNATTPVAAFQLPSGEAKRPPSAALAFNGCNTTLLLNRTYLPVTSSLPPTVPTLQASRLTAPVFPAAAAAGSNGSVWQRQ